MQIKHAYSNTNTYLNILQKPDADITDLVTAGIETKDLEKLLEKAISDNTKYNSFTLNNIINLEIEPRDFILSPIIPNNGITLLYSKRGVGKTHMALEIGVTVSLGDILFDRYIAPNPVSVLYIDGEIAAAELQARLIAILKRRNILELPHDNFKIISNDLLNDNGIINLITEEGQKAIEEHLFDVKLLIIDNLSTLCNGGRENESESWQSMQNWLLGLRKKGISVLLIHHAGKNDTQRGTSKKEDIVDTVIKLKHPANYDPSEGVRFEVHYEKNRGFYGEDAKSFEVKLVKEDGIEKWVSQAVSTDIKNKIQELSESGLSIRQIAEEIDLSKSAVGRILKEISKE